MAISLWKCSHSLLAFQDWMGSGGLLCWWEPVQMPEGTLMSSPVREDSFFTRLAPEAYHRVEQTWLWQSHYTGKVDFIAILVRIVLRPHMAVVQLLVKVFYVMQIYLLSINRIHQNKHFDSPEAARGRNISRLPPSVWGMINPDIFSQNSLTFGLRTVFSLTVSPVNTFDTHPTSS